MRFSVIIPAFNESVRIGETIRAVLCQNIPRKDYEVIVVDNASTDKTAEEALRAGADRVVEEKKQGTNMAREKGFRESRGEIVAFLDADCLPPPDWLARIEKALSQKDVVAVSGPYNYGFKGIIKILNDLYTRFVMPAIPKVLHFFFRKKAGMIIGGNFGAWRWAIEKTAGLPAIPFYGDDSAIAMRLSRQAGKVVFDPNFKVKSSSRRFKKYGLLPLVMIYAFHYLRGYFRKK